MYEDTKSTNYRILSSFKGYSIQTDDFSPQSKP